MLILIRAGQTDWQAQSRFAGDTDLPLNEVGHREAVADAHAIAGMSPVAVHTGAEQSTKQTAAVVASELGLKAKVVKELREMDLGHWEGLTIEDFRERFARIYKQWRQEPMAIEPPAGEAVADVAQRLLAGIRKILRKSDSGAIVVTLGQFSHAILRCQLDDGGYEKFWDYVDGIERWHAFVPAAERLQLPPQSA